MKRIGWTVALNLAGTAFSLYGAFTDFHGTIHFISFTIVSVTAGMLIEQGIQLKSKYSKNNPA